MRASGKPVVSPAIDRGKAEFDAIHAAIATLQDDISRFRQQAVIGIGLALIVIMARF